jgi:LexA-binding, inner membrane-associated putative hydrolase
MAGFVVHATSTLVVSTGLSAYLCASNHFPLAWGGMLCALGALGGILPDIDSKESKIARYSGLILGMILLGIVVTQFANYLYALAVIPMVKLIDVGLKKWTTHRGVFHSIPMCFLFATAAFIVSDMLRFPTIFSLYCAGFLGGGYFFHLLLDEIWSLRKGVGCPSLGTGMQIYRSAFWQSFLLTYSLLGLLLYFTPFFRNWMMKNLLLFF